MSVPKDAMREAAEKAVSQMTLNHAEWCAACFIGVGDDNGECSCGEKRGMTEHFDRAIREQVERAVEVDREDRNAVFERALTTDVRDCSDCGTVIMCWAHSRISQAEEDYRKRLQAERDLCDRLAVSLGAMMILVQRPSLERNTARDLLADHARAREEKR